MSDTTLIDELLSGTAFLDDIDDWVARWHRAGSELPIWEHLGMTRDEYALWVEQPEALRFIVVAHERDEPVEDVISHYEERELAAARAEDADQARTVAEWLRRTGRLK
jgi:hypothetical protein